jgi:hypothetical protein
VSWFGRSLAAGDFDCDGADDLAINAFGHVEVVYGADKGLDPATSQLFFADELGVGPGLGALAAGNFDSNVASRGDAFGFPACMDLAVGSSDAIAVVYGMPSDAVDPGLQLTTKPPTAFFGSDGFGRDLSIGRFDGGKYHDLAVAYQGGAFVLAGSSTGLVDIGSVDVPLVSATLGTMPSTVGYGDFAGDGMGDLVVGHAYDAPAGCVAGKCGSFDVADFVPAVSFKVDSVTSWTADDLPDASIADTTRLASRVTQGRAMFEPACFSFDPTDIEF